MAVGLFCERTSDDERARTASILDLEHRRRETQRMREERIDLEPPTTEEMDALCET